MNKKQLDKLESIVMRTIEIDCDKGLYDADNHIDIPFLTILYKQQASCYFLDCSRMMTLDDDETTGVNIYKWNDTKGYIKSNVMLSCQKCYDEVHVVVNCGVDSSNEYGCCRCCGCSCHRDDKSDDKTK